MPGLWVNKVTTRVVWVNWAVDSRESWESDWLRVSAPGGNKLINSCWPIIVPMTVSRVYLFFCKYNWEGVGYQIFMGVVSGYTTQMHPTWIVGILNACPCQWWCVTDIIGLIGIRWPDRGETQSVGLRLKMSWTMDKGWMARSLVLHLIANYIVMQLGPRKECE